MLLLNPVLFYAVSTHCLVVLSNPCSCRLLSWCLEVPGNVMMLSLSELLLLVNRLFYYWFVLVDEELNGARRFGKLCVERDVEYLAVGCK